MATKEKKYYLQVINIKLQTLKEGAEKDEAYMRLIEKLSENKIHMRVAENKHMIIYNGYRSKTTFSNVEYIYGTIGKGIYFEQDEINSIIISKAKTEKTKNDLDKISGAKTTTYIFIPSAHRFCILMNSGITGNETYKFLKSSLKSVADKADIVEVEIEKDSKIVDEIFQAYKIHSVDYTISYTNDDTMSEIADAYDARLKRLHIGKMNLKAEADHNGELNMEEDDELLKGGIELATSNGTINKVVITKKQGEAKKTISNIDKTRNFEVTANDENFKNIIVNFIMKLFRNIEL